MGLGYSTPMSLVRPAVSVGLPRSPLIRSVVCPSDALSGDSGIGTAKLCNIYLPVTQVCSAANGVAGVPPTFGIFFQSSLGTGSSIVCCARLADVCGSGLDVPGLALDSHVHLRRRMAYERGSVCM